MKKSILKVLILIIIFILPYKANALILEKDNIVLLPEEEKEITLNVDLKKYYIEQVSFTLENDTNLKTTFIPSENSKDIEKNGKHTITFNEVQRGIVELGTIKTSIINTNIKSSTISFKNPIAITSFGDEIELDEQELTVSLADHNLLKSIDSKIVVIPLIKDKYEYTVKVKDNIKELDLKPIPNNEEYKIDISSQELSNNKIEILVKDEENNIEQTYTINIEKEKTNKEPIIIDKSYKKTYIGLSILFTIILLIGIIINKLK